ncbi:polyamine-transporting ATPase 13A3-like isoform X2 [Daktulosphaira vitifoliae]|uniref:polyamine-transporting ATPase 13A3-like isoform X2 n=1 Tax=Daktulosphaira vitifoliae TaxID=58002 RepID=UPI0021AA161F|nr:polyamine-transporting ATPase 13A3-like isoform X2 [Daktulosphaira vitifoliae]
MVLCMGCCSKRDYTLLDGMSSYQPSSNTDFTETIAVKCGYSYNFTKTVIFHIVAVCLLGIPYLAIHWSSNLKLLLLMSKCPLSTADCILVNDMNNYNNIYEIKTSVIKCMKGEQKVVKHFEHQLLKYIWDDRENVFKLLQGLDNGTTTLSKLLDKSHGLTTEEHESQLELFGKNEIVIEVPSYWKLFIVEVLNPFYVFQIFSIGLWFFDEYEIYAVCVLVSSAFSIGTSLYQLKEQSRSLKKTVDTHNCDIYTVLRRNSENIKVKAEYLVPGDVIVIPPGGGNIACDALLLSGNCIVDESLLTGESEPITKSPPSSIEEFCYVSSAHKHHTLYCGTRILQSRFYSGAQVLALVVRTGSSTAKGNLIRSIMFPKEIDFEFYLDSIKFVIIMFIVATIGMGYCAYLYLMRQASLEYIVIRSLDIYTVVVPPALPAAMTIGIVHSLQRLKRHKIYCTCQSRINVSGKIKLVCFDKEFEEPGVDSSRFDNLLPSIVRPPKQLDIEDNPVEIGIVHQYPFNSKTQSMCVIGKVFGSRNYTVYCKGAPEKIIQSCLSHTIPSNTFSVLEKFGSLGYRILALAYKNLPKKVNWKNLYHLKLEEVQSNLIFLGFLVMQNKLKPQSRSVISQLRTANIKSVMVTGDNLFTGISVAKESLIIPSLNINLAVVTATPSTEITRGDIKIEPALGNTLSEPMHYAIDGKSWAVLESEFPSWLPQIVTKGLVFGRMLPEQKVKLVEYFQSLGYVTAMCGDGANDAGALKAAHVGISLSQAEASIAAPFTSQVTNVTCVTKVIREGRCALVTSFGIFKYMTCYSLIQFITLVILYSRGIMLGNFQFLYFDFVLTTSLAIVMGDSEPADKVFPHRPLSRILTPKNLIPLFLQILVCALIQQASLFYLTLQNWYIPAIPAWSDDDVIVCWENTTLFFTSAYQYIILALVLNKGQPHRKPFYMNLSFTIVVIILILFTLMLQTIDVSTIKNIFDIVVLDQTHENEQRLFLVTLLAFPVLHFYLAIMIEILGESMLLKICINIVKRKRAPKNIYKQVLNESSNFMSI